MKYFIPFLLMMFVATGYFSYSFGYNKAILSVQATYGSFSDDTARKHQLMADAIWLNARLKQTPTVDLTLGSSLEWTNAYISSVQQHGASLPVVTSVANLNSALQTRAGSISQLCSNPNATAVIVKSGNVAVPQ